jgi:glutamyl-tRNA reductase
MLVMVLGLSYKTAPLALMERVAFSPETLPAALTALHEQVAHGVILSTCNRVEVYAQVGHPDSGRRALLRYLADYHGLRTADVAPYVYTYDQEEAVGHLFRVVCGLDSLVLGETQILGQVRDAHQAAQRHGRPGPLLARLFRQALEVGKRAHRETRICQSAASVSEAAVGLARQSLSDLGSRTALVVGAGDTSRLTARTLQASGVGELLVMNRTVEHAEALAHAVGGEALPLGALQPALSRADLLISSTGASSYVVEAPTVRTAMAERPCRPLYCIDVAVPRDVDPAVGAVPNVYLYNLDDLATGRGDHADSRASDVRQVERIVEDEIVRFFHWWDAREVVPTIAALRARAESIREAELTKALARLGPLADRDRETLEALTSAIVNKLLHQPTVQLKQHSGDHDGRSYAPALRALFQLPDQ